MGLRKIVSNARNTSAARMHHLQSGVPSSACLRSIESRSPMSVPATCTWVRPLAESSLRKASGVQKSRSDSLRSTFKASN